MHAICTTLIFVFVNFIISFFGFLLQCASSTRKSQFNMADQMSGTQQRSNTITTSSPGTTARSYLKGSSGTDNQPQTLVSPQQHTISKTKRSIRSNRISEPQKSPPAVDPKTKNTKHKKSKKKKHTKKSVANSVTLSVASLPHQTPTNIGDNPKSNGSQSNSSSKNKSYSSSSLTRDIVAHFESAAQKKELGIADQVRQEVILKRLPLEDRARIKRIFEQKKKDQKQEKISEKHDMKELDSDEEYFEKSIKPLDKSKSRKNSVVKTKRSDRIESRIKA